uniref:Molybdopterin oxidoreductase family protein n=1 Tax=Candidatus Methanomethylicus mesodigestus TaxID=1867258 RepID=A0A7C3J3J4_9CREN
MPEKRRFFAACPRDCYDTCALYAHVSDGRLESVEGRREHGLTRGALCRKGQKALDYVYSEERLKHPMRRTGKKGSGSFENISWDKAYDLIIEKIQESISDYGPSSILPYMYAGHMGILNRYYPYRFFNRIGASEILYTICSEAGKQALRLHYGTSAGMDPEDLVNSSLIVFWGFNPAWTSQHIYAMAKRSGARTIAIDPVRSQTAAHSDVHLQLTPGTDAALALGVVKYAIDNDLVDIKFINDHTIGFEGLKAASEPFTSEKVAALCGIRQDEFVSFASEYCRSKPAAILIGLGIQRNINGGDMVRAIGLLPAVTGNLGVRGAGFFYSNSDYFTVDLNLVKSAEADLGKQRRRINMVKLGGALLDRELDPPIKMLYVYNSNPAAVCPDLNRVFEGLAREDLFTVVHDLFMTDTAEMADLVLPATSYFETFDIQFSYGGLYVALNEKAIEPIGECKSNYQVFSELSARMGFHDLVEDPEELAEKVLASGTYYMVGITLDELKQHGFARLKTPEIPHTAFGDLKFPTPSGKVEISSSLAVAQGLPPVPAHTAVTGSFPLRLLTPFHRDLHKSQYFNIGSIFGAKDQEIEMNPSDMEERGLSDGDRVLVWNDRGDCIMKVRLSAKVRKGVALSYGIPWPKLVEGGRTANFTTSSAVSDIGGCSTFHTNYVEVSKLA